LPLLERFNKDHKFDPTKMKLTYADFNKPLNVLSVDSFKIFYLFTNDDADKKCLYQYKLLSIINDIFTYVIDPHSNKKVIRINPNLNEEGLQKSIEKARRLIVDLYITCENDYVNGIKIYEAIVEAKILETTEKQIQNLENKAKNIISETNKNVPSQVSQPFIAQEQVKPMPILQT
jgi:hypothetical protein